MTNGRGYRFDRFGYGLIPGSVANLDKIHHPRNAEDERKLEEFCQEIMEKDPNLCFDYGIISEAQARERGLWDIFSDYAKGRIQLTDKLAVRAKEENIELLLKRFEQMQRK